MISAPGRARRPTHLVRPQQSAIVSPWIRRAMFGPKFRSCFGAIDLVLATERAASCYVRAE